jgi:hypothetical protein
MRRVKLRFAVPLTFFEIFEGRQSAGLVLAERQGTRGRPDVFFGDQDNPDTTIGQVMGGLQEFELALLVDAVNHCRHGIHSVD